MQSPIKVIIKAPGEPPYYDEIPNELSVLQATVDGYIETVTIAEDLVVICNEEGRLSGLPYNCTIAGVDLVGTIILAGVDGEEFCSIPKVMESAPALGIFVRTREDAAEEQVNGHICPVCKREYSADPVRSRCNGKEICSECAQIEAVADFWRFVLERKRAAREERR